VAEQNAERAKFIVAKAEQEKEALIIRSEGDSEAARLVSDALQRSGKGLIELRRIETAVQVRGHTIQRVTLALVLTCCSEPAHHLRMSALVSLLWFVLRSPSLWPTTRT